MAQAIVTVAGVSQKGRRLGRWLAWEEARTLSQAPNPHSIRRNAGPGTARGAGDVRVAPRDMEFGGCGSAGEAPSVVGEETRESIRNFGFRNKMVSLFTSQSAANHNCTEVYPARSSRFKLALFAYAFGND
jgi:hypothetical protein